MSPNFFFEIIPVCLQAFVKMVGANVNEMEEQVTQAEGELGTLPGAFKKILRTMSVPGFLNVRAPSHACEFLLIHLVCLLSIYRLFVLVRMFIK